MAAGLTAVAIGGSVVAVNWLSTPPGAPVATPMPLQLRPMSGVTASEVLNDLAARAAQQPPPAGSGNVLYTRLRIAAFTPAQDTAGTKLDPRVVPYRQETWLTPEGTGRLLRVEQEPPAGDPFTMDVPLPAPPSAPPEVRQPDETTLRAWLRQQGKDWHTADWLRADTQLHRIADPAVTAELLRVLATLPDVTLDGRTTTRGGRSALMVSTIAKAPAGADEWFPEQQVCMLFDPETGSLVATETIALSVRTDLIGRSIAVPTTIGYTEWQQVAYVEDTTTTP